MRGDRKTRSIRRREFLQLTGAGAFAPGEGIEPEPALRRGAGRAKIEATARRSYNGPYAGEHLTRVAFPLGGIGAGMLCIEGSGALSHVSLRHRPEVFNEPCVFAAVGMKGAPAAARVLEGPVPRWKLFGPAGSGNGLGGKSYGLPRFGSASLLCRFPFTTVTLTDPEHPLEVEITAWSPFEPGDADGSSLPVAALEYRFRNRGRVRVEAVFSWNAVNFMGHKDRPQAARSVARGFVLWGGAREDAPWDEGSFMAAVAEPDVRVNAAWFRGGWFDPLTLAWKDVVEAACFDRAPLAEGGPPSPGASLFVPMSLAPGASRTITLRFAWYVGRSELRSGKDPAGTKAADPPERHRPWYAGRFGDVEEVAAHFAGRYEELRRKAALFRDRFYDTTLPPEVVEAVAANLAILKSPTVLRQADGRLWAWEGCSDGSGCCSGSCTHVWNYAQALPHLFPDLERSLRETELGPSQAANGHQTFRAALPIRPVEHDFHAAADGQLGGIMKVHRDWRLCGDTEWLRRLWPSVRRSLDYCIATWDPGEEGMLVEPHHNTYDIEFWGPDGMCTSFYLGALAAAAAMGKALGDDVARYAGLLERGRARAEAELFDGEYFVQKVRWKDLRAGSPLEAKSMVGEYSPEARALLEEGPKYQYGPGCLSDGVLGAWMAEVCGVSPVLDAAKVRSHLLAVHRHNLAKDLSGHANPQRPSYACGGEGGLLLCTWPKGGAPSLPFVYSNEVWTGIEYEVASHLMAVGQVAEGLEIVRACRDRYDGRVRNPFDEYECGHWYARAMSSYALLQGLTGARYDAVEKVLHLRPRLRGDFRAFLAVAGGYGTVGVRDGKPFFDPAVGKPEVREIRFEPGKDASA